MNPDDPIIHVSNEKATVVNVSDTGQRAHYSRSFAANYNKLIGLETGELLRALHQHGKDPRGTGAIILSALETNEYDSVLDTCSGGMYDILLIEGERKRNRLPSVTRIVANEIDESLFELGTTNIDAISAELHHTERAQHSWQQLAVHFPEEKFDVMLCTGNSYSHLSDVDQRRLSLANFAVLTNDVCIIDCRNFDRFLANKEVLLEESRTALEQHDPKQSNPTLFPGSVNNFPVEISNGKIVFAYMGKQDDEPYGTVEFYPLRRDTFLAELHEFFGEVQVLYDGVEKDLSQAELEDKEKGPSTIQCICRKPKHDVAADFLAQQ